MPSRFLGVEDGGAGKTKEGDAAEAEACPQISDHDQVGDSEKPNAPEERIAGDPQDPPNDLRAIEQLLRSHDDRVRRGKTRHHQNADTKMRAQAQAGPTAARARGAARARADRRLSAR